MKYVYLKNQFLQNLKLVKYELLEEKGKKMRVRDVNSKNVVEITNDN